MTTNQDRAAEVIEGYYPPCRKCQDRSQWGIPEVGECDDCADQCKVIAQALADAGLLAPDLPTPDRDGRWWPTTASIGNININPAGEVAIHSGNFRDMRISLTPARAIDLAMNIIAAANHAEKEKK